MLRKITNYYILLLITLLLTACGGSGSDDSSENDTTTPSTTSPTLDELKSSVRNMDLSDAQAFVITGSETTAGRPAVLYKSALLANRTPVDMDPNSLYKVNSDGTLERVAVKDDNGTEVDRGLVIPFELVDVDENYLFMWFSIKEENVPYLVHKQTGLAYNGEGVIWDCSPNQSCQVWYGKTRSDVNGNIYLVSHFTEKPTIIKIDTSNLGGTSITAQAVHSQYDANDWEVDDSGRNLIFRAVDNNSNSVITDSSYITIHVDLTSGRLTPIEQTMTSVVNGYDTVGSFYRGLDGKLYVGGRSSSSGLDADRLFKVSNDSNGNLVLTDEGLSDTPYLWNGGNSRYVINGKLFYLNATTIYEFDHVSGQFTKDSTPANQFKNGSDSVKQYAVSNGYIYFFGTDKVTSVDTVYRYDPTAKTGTLFPSDASSPINNFDIDSIRVLSNDKVWFEAFRFSDSATVIGELDMATSTIEIVDTIDANEPAIITLEAIHPADFVVIDGSYQDWHTDLRTTSDDTSDGSDGHELIFLSHQQTSSQFFGLVEFNEDNIASQNSATIITVDSMYEVVINAEDNFIRDLSDNSETTFVEVGAIVAIGQAVEFSVPLDAMEGIGSIPTVAVKRFSLHDISAVDAYNTATKEHTFTVSLPRVLNSSDTISVMLENFEVEITSTTVSLIASGSSIDLTEETTGLDTLSIEVLINDSDIDDPNKVVTLEVQDQLPILEDLM